jgi:hypothetical protein
LAIISLTTKTAEPTTYQVGGHYEDESGNSKVDRIALEGNAYVVYSNTGGKTIIMEYYVDSIGEA